MAYDRSMIDELIKRSDIVNVISNYINVTKKGRSFVALCPFHDDKNPSLQISRDKQIFKCFVCGQGGNAIQFVQSYEKIQFMDAARKVADLVGFTDERLSSKSYAQTSNPELKPYYDCMIDALSFYKFSLTTEQGEAGLQYLESRHISEVVRHHFEIGYSLPDGKGIIQFLLGKGHSRSTMEHLGIITMNQDPLDRLAGRIIFPIFDRYGRPVGFSGRKIDTTEGAKYINSPESKIFIKSNILYNYHTARDAAKQATYMYVLEGFMDVIALYRAGIEAAVAIMGTAFTKQHLAMLRIPDVELRICLDGDSAGQAAMMKMMAPLDTSRLTYRFVMNAGDTRDSDEILDQEGPEALKRYLNNLANRLEFALEYYSKTRPLKTLEQRQELVKMMVPLLAASNNNLELEEYIKKLSNATAFTRQVIEDMVNSYRSQKGVIDVERLYTQFRPEAKHLRRFQKAERQLLYFMLNDARAIDFYKTKIEYFYDEIYRAIANFIIERSSQEEIPSLNQLLSDINTLESDKKDVLVKEVTALALEKDYPKCDESLLNEINDVITLEREVYYYKQRLTKALEGKDELEKARIITEYNKIMKKYTKLKEPKGE